MYMIHAHLMQLALSNLNVLESLLLSTSLF